MKKTMSKNNKVIVAMSGGVDSSVAAALLKRDGFNVIGVFLKLWPGFDGKKAQEAAKKLGIDFYILDFQKEFKKKVVDYFIKEYKLGRTPNPCVVCNKEIKFELLFQKIPGDFLATGHYVRLKNGRLFKAKDKNKDQSYFLWQLNQKQLSRVLFPVGGYTKPQVRALARKFKLLVLDIRESQEICFIQTSLNDFLKKYIKPKPGRIVDKEGRKIGEHPGLCFYTIGQRKGTRLSAGPYYVLDKDTKKNVLIVTKNERDLYKKELIVKDVNWISKKKLPLKVMAKIRYRHKLASAVVDKNKVIFTKPQRAITPGQSAVFYKGQELLGGGIILRG